MGASGLVGKWARALFGAAFVAMLVSPGVAFAQPLPVASLTGVPGESFIGENITFTVSLDNASASATGYGPYIDLVLPKTGADGNDGLSFVGATYLGSPVTTVLLTFDGAGHATHPYARTSTGAAVIVNGTPGNQLVVLQLPFGSFTPTQPPADVVVTAALSNLADAGTPLTILAHGGFQFGADPLDNPTSGDPSIIGSDTSASTTPTLLRLKKTYIGPEDETATGPNFPRQYLIEVDIANGQTITNLDLTDVLPSNLQFVSVTSTTVHGSATATTAVSTPSTTTPGGTLTRRFASVTGTTATNDATLVFTFYVPRVDAATAVIIDPTTGDDVQSTDDAKTQGTWAPIDPRDATGLVSSDITAADHILTDKSIAIQKSVAIVTDTGAAGYSPGDVLEYTLNFQISDFFAFQNLIVTDVLGDGLRRDPGFVPTLRVTEHGSTSSGDIAGGNFSFVVDSPGTGSTTGTFRVSDERLTRALDTRVLGGCVPAGGTGGPPPDCTTFNGGGTTVTVVYRAIIQNNFTDTFPSGDPSVDEGDVLTNAVAVAGDVLSTATLAPTGSSEDDNSAAEVTIQRGVLTKTIYAVNGSTTLPSPLRIGPGDTVTYKINLTLPTSDVEPLTLTDFLPLPIFDATTLTTFDGGGPSATPPASGHASFGPGDTFFALSGIVPAMTTDATGNSVKFSYTQFDSPTSPSTAIDLLLTVTVSNLPFADKLFLTNQVRAAEGTTQLDASTKDAIVQVQLTEPDVKITKGVVATDNAAGVFSPTPVGPVTFTTPGTAGYRGSGAITSAGLATQPINSNLGSVDAGDRVTFAIVIQNAGSGVNGAFDIHVRDTIPAGFSVPAAAPNLNLHVTNGTGATIAFTTIGGGLFDPAGGIELTDNGATGALGPNDPTNGLDIAVITYDLQIDPTATPKQAIVNTATVTNFAGSEGGPNFTPAGRADDATVTIASLAVAKTILGTNQAHTTGNNVAIGEQVQYQIVVRVPEGEAASTTLVDTLPLGLAIVSLDSITASAALTTSAGTFANVLSSATVTNVGAGVDNAGRAATFSFGTLTNSDTNNATAETITIALTAIVIDGGSNDRGDTRTNSATVTWTGGSATGTSPAVTIVEPRLQVAKTALPTTGDAGDTITFTVTLTHAAVSNADAFDVTLSDLVPAGMTFGLVTGTSGVAPTVTPSAGGFSATIASFPLGSTTTIQFTATLDPGINPGQVLTNTAASAWTSLPGAPGQQSTFNTVSTERTGSTLDPGGAVNNYTASGSATVTGRAEATAKTIAGTNLPSTTGNNVAIGEEVQYQVQVVVPEGTSNGVTLVDTLGPGLAFVGVDSITASPSLSTSVSGGFPGVVAGVAVTNVGAGPQNAGRQVTFTLGTLTNTDNNNATSETLTFTYTAVVINTAASVRGVTAHNTAVYTSSASSVTASAPDVTIVEPTLQVAKTASPTSGDAGDTITYTLTISHGGTSNADAYDVSLSDAIPAGMTYVGGSAAFASGVAPSSLNVAAGTLTATYAHLALAQTSVLTFQATLNATPTPVTPGATITNNVNITWTSLPTAVTTPQSTFNTLSTERTGSTGDPGGVANTYSGTNHADVTVHTNSLAGFVYLDANNDGTRTLGEAGIGGVVMHLTGTDHLGAPVLMTAVTLPDGSYSFTGLRPGTYTITETQPAGFVDGLDVVGTPALGATAANDVLGVMTIPAGANTNGVDFDFGETSSADLSVTKTDNPDPVLPGGTLVYTIQVANAGPNPAINALLTDPLPAGTTFVSLVSPGGWSCTTPAVAAAGVISCQDASLASGATATFTLTVHVDAALVAHSVLRNVATITSSSNDPNPTNNQANEPTLVAAPVDADLAVTKTDNLDPVSVGQNVTYTITVHNNGPATTDATVTDTVPATLTLVSATPSAGSCGAGNPIVCTIPGMALGDTATITVVTTATVPGVVTNTVTVSGSAPDPNTTNNQASEPTTVVEVGGTDVAITKTAPLTVARGGPLTYTIVVTNRGPNGATGVQVADPLAVPGLTFASNAGDCATAFPCALGAMAVGETRTIISTWLVSPTYTGPSPIVNTATVSTTSADSDPSNDTATARTIVGDPGSADLAIVKFDSPDAAVAGTVVSYTLVVTNNGPGTAMNASVTDTLPAGVTLITSTPSQGTCSGSAPITCPLGTIASGAVATIAVTVQTATALPTPNPMVNAATVASTTADPDPSNNTTTQPTTIIARTDLQITKTAPPTVFAGANLVYTITVVNNGPSDATNVIVADATPAGLVFVSNSGACATAFPCALGTVPAGATRVITATFTVPSSYLAPSPIVNTSTVSTDTTETNTANNTSTAQTTLLLDAELSLTKTGPATVTAGTQIAYTLTIRNNGPSDATGVQVIDPTPSGLTFVSNGGSCVTAFPCTYASIPAGQTRTIIATYLVPSGYTAPSPIVNTGTVSSVTPDSNPANNSQTVLTTLGPASADLAVTKAGPATVVSGGNVVYTITIQNNGPSDAAGVMLADPLPPGLSFVSNAGDCTTAFPCSLGTIPAGQTRTITSTLLVPASYSTPEVITNTATVSSTTDDPNPGNNVSTTQASAGADIIVTKTADNTQPRGGQIVTFTITTRNAGPNNATGVQVTDQMPFGLTFVSATPSQGTFDAGSGIWNIGALANGQSVTLQVACQVTASGPLTNVAHKTAGDQNDPNTSNNSSGVAVAAFDPAEVQILMQASSTTVALNGDVTFTITAANGGPDAGTGIQVVDQLPAGLMFLSATASDGTYDAATGTWEIPIIANGGHATLAIVARVTQAGPITNVARRIAQDELDPVAANDAGGVTINGTSADVQIVTTLDRHAPVVGEVVTFTIIATNNGPNQATGLDVRDVLPDGLTFASVTASQGVYVPETGRWSVGTLDAPGVGNISMATLTLRAVVTATGMITNTASIAASDVSDTDPFNDTSSITLNGAAGNLRADVRFAGDADAVGGTFDFFVRATNAGHVDLRGPFTVVLPFPEEVTFTSSDPDVTCTPIGGSRVVTCTRTGLTLAYNQSFEVAFHGTVTQPLPAGLAIFGSVFTPDDRLAQDNVATALIKAPAVHTADVRVTQTAAATPLPAGARQMVYTNTIADAGPDAATGVVFQDVVPPGLTAVTVTASQGTCASMAAGATTTLACDLGSIPSGGSVTVTVNGIAAAGQQIAHLVAASGRESDPDTSNNAALDVLTNSAGLAPDRDTDGDGMPDVWESQMGLNPGVADAAGDDDHDGVSNLDEYRQGTHPRGFYKQYFAEGASNEFFGTMFSVLNPEPVHAAAATIELMRDTGEISTMPVPLGAMRRRDVDARDILGTWQGAFSAVIESDRPLATDRLTWWDPRGYGTGLESGLVAPSTHWLFAEGATTGTFQLFFLLQNPDMTHAADVTIRYLLPSGSPVVKTYQIAPHTRLTVFVNEIPELASTELSAEVIATRPIVAERAMYRSTATQLLAAGHVGGGATAASTDWFFAEGATGDFFNLFLLLGNPGAVDAAVDVRYLLPNGQTLVKTYTVAANTRRTIFVAGEDPLLASTSVGMTVSSSQPIVAERAMWWPGPAVAPDWYESHVVLGATTTGTRWAVASAAEGGPLAEQTFVLVANQAATAGQLRITAVFDDGSQHVQEMPIGATARLTLELGTVFPESAGHALSVIVESLGNAPVPLVVEGSRYGSPDGQVWGAGAAALATKLQ
jgi:uncharacterized repeat protein (TIGR01451 family)/fimbrial isopeptide formation D2 family protein